METSEGQVALGQTLPGLDRTGREDSSNTHTLPNFPFSPGVGVSRDLGPFRLVQ